MTIHPSAGAEYPGTFRGLIEKIPYLKDLGVTAVELLPVQEFNEYELVRVNPLNGERLKNYWGYNPTAFMAPNGSYSSAGSLGQQKLEFKEMVKALHEAGIEVILDIVLNHTAEGSELGPTFCWRGLENPVYYLLSDDPRFYKDYTGTGNTIRANHPVVRDLILDALRNWVVEMHVDGFRFDLASVLGRDQEGHIVSDPPLLGRIAEDPVLRKIKMIAEAWDAAGAFQVGRFYKRPWAEWNSHYRDEVRRFWRGDPGMTPRLADRLCGSADVYAGSGRGPESSINYVTCHDGFTLNDLVSYEHKHNEANGEFNHDGMNVNYSANYGVEGETDDPDIEVVRLRQIKNLILTLFVSRGVPMLLGGDEFRRTQHGNNNAYCQDNETSWHDWRLLERHAGVHRFTRGMIAFRQANPVLSRTAYYRTDEVRWFDPDGREPDWSRPGERRLACRIDGDDSHLYLAFNAGTDAAAFTLPASPNGTRWHLKADTFQPAPQDLLEDGSELPLEQQEAYRVESRSSVILLAR